jgi:hypothetical protein
MIVGATTHMIRNIFVYIKSYKIRSRICPQRGEPVAHPYEVMRIQQRYEVASYFLVSITISENLQIFCVLNILVHESSAVFNQYRH